MAPRYCRPADLQRERNAFDVMERYICGEIIQTIGLQESDGYDRCDGFTVIRPGYVIEHKWRGNTPAHTVRLYGGIWLEVDKYNKVTAAAATSNSIPAYLITLSDGTVLLADMRDADTSKTTKARRHSGEGGNEPCYQISMNKFTDIGKAELVDWDENKRYER